jgi:hypothetical protein
MYEVKYIALNQYLRAITYVPKIFNNFQVFFKKKIASMNKWAKQIHFNEVPLVRFGPWKFGNLPRYD